jgi:hypothetical protein
MGLTIELRNSKKVRWRAKDSRKRLIKLFKGLILVYNTNRGKNIRLHSPFRLEENVVPNVVPHDIHKRQRGSFHV